jgi:hypothetical protein
VEEVFDFQPGRWPPPRGTAAAGNHLNSEVCLDCGKGLRNR